MVSESLATPSITLRWKERKRAKTVAAESLEEKASRRKL